MESSYGIGVKNRYAVFIGDEEEDPLEIVTKTTDLKPKPTTEKTTNRSKALNDSKITNTNHQNIIKDNKTSKDSLIKSKTSDVSQTSTKTKDMNTKGESNRNPRQKSDRIPRTRDNQTGDKPNHISDRQNRPPRPSGDQKDIDDLKNQRNRDDNRFGNSTDIRERRERSDSDRRGGRNGRNGSSRRGGSRFGEERRGKRDLDRHSGSDKAGVKAVDKREGGGAHNWGKINDFSNEEPFNADTQELTDRSADETALEVNDTNPENDANTNEELPKEPEPKEMTLEEYKQQLEEKRVQPKFNLRKPGEGEDNSQWKKTFVLKKKEEEEEVEYEEIEVEEEIRKGRHKQLLDIEINFRDEGRDFPRRGGDGRRGGGRDRRDRDRGERGERVDRGDRGDRERGDRERGERSGPPGERADRGERGERSGDRPERRGGDRETRGGGGSRGGARSDRPFGDRNRTRRPRDGKEQTAPKVDDWNDFPSLAAA